MAELPPPVSCACLSHAATPWVPRGAIGLHQHGVVWGCTETPGSLGQRSFVPSCQAPPWGTAVGALPSPCRQSPWQLCTPGSSSWQLQVPRGLPVLAEEQPHTVLPAPCSQPLCPQDLGSKDLKRERLFLVCQIIRVGRMDLRETLSRKLSTGLRRPFGISGEQGLPEQTPHRPLSQLLCSDPDPRAPLCVAVLCPCPPCSLPALPRSKPGGASGDPRSRGPREQPWAPPVEGGALELPAPSSALTNVPALSIDPHRMNLVGNY